MMAWSQIRTSPVFTDIRNEWSLLLEDTAKKEQDYQQFLRDHAGFFFPRKSDISGDQLILEKIRLGSEYITDFVILNGNRSYGFEYTLVEIESPHNKIYTKAGTQTSDLSAALQQIRDWKRWITSNLEMAKKLFPSKSFILTGVPSIKYVVIIGRRNSNQEETEKRNQILRDEGIEIRSFDYFTDTMISRNFHSHIWISNDLSLISEKNNNEFANPFYTAISDVEWRTMLKEFLTNYSHMVGQNLQTILSNRKYNNIRMNAFIDWLNQQGVNIIADWEKKLVNYT